MGSLIEQVFAAMPLVALGNQLRGTGALGDVDASKLYTTCSFLGPVTPPPVTRRPPGADVIENASNDGKNPQIPIWSYEVSAQPHTFQNLGCRVLEDGFRQYRVLDSIEFGHREGDRFPSEIVVESGGYRYYLPIDWAFLLCSVRTKKHAYNKADASPLFPLEATYDEAQVFAFVYDVPLEVAYEVDPKGAPPPAKESRKVKDPMWVTDPVAWAKVSANLARAVELSAGGGAASPSGESPPSRGEAAAGAATPLRSTLFDDDAWNPVPERLWAQAGGDDADVTTLPSRVLVLVSLTPCREHDDFQPEAPVTGGIAGMGRLYPQVMIKATFPIDGAEVAMRFKRPAFTTITDGGACGCHEMNDRIGSLLVADTNRPDFTVAGLPPHWNAIFAYYCDDPVGVLGLNKPIALTSDGGDRTAGSVSRSTPTLLGAPVVRKVPRQGAFDNIHVAPRMKLPPEIAGVALPGSDKIVPLSDVVVRAGHTVNFEEIVMAPICAHDCFHGHWRWGDDTATRATFGWDATGPNRVPGAPMVPLHHEVVLVLDSAHAFTVQERSQPAKELPPDTWELFGSPGYAYGLSARTLGLKGGRVSVQAVTDVIFVDKDANPITTMDSWAVFYFLARNAFDSHWDGTIEVFERVHLEGPLKTLMDG